MATPRRLVKRTSPEKPNLKRLTYRIVQLTRRRQLRQVVDYVLLIIRFHYDIVLLLRVVSIVISVSNGIGFMSYNIIGVWLFG